MRQLVFKPIASFVILSLLAPSAFAWQQEFPVSVHDPKRVAALVNSDESLKPVKRVEVGTKRDLIANFVRNPKEFFATYTSPNFSDLQKSWINEVQEAMKERSRDIPKTNLAKERERKTQDIYGKYFEGTKIDLAKAVAKKLLYDKVKENWSCENRHPARTICLSQTIYNKDGIGDSQDELARALAFTALQLRDSFYFLPTSPYARPGYYLFELPDLGYVQIEKKSLNRGRVVFKIGSDIQNPLEPGADAIKADNDDGHGGSLPSPSSKRGSSARNSDAPPADNSYNAAPPPPPAYNSAPPPAPDYNGYGNDYNNSAQPPPPPPFLDDDDF